jgi:dienelactone hydrolase
MRRLLTLAAMLMLSPFALGEVKTQAIDYQFDGITLKGFLAYDEATKDKRPGVVVVHEWWGLNDYAKSRAKMLAELGYVAFCADMYGNGDVTDHPKKAGELATLVRKNADVWRGRAMAAIKTLQAQPDAKQIAILGYCFGGSTALQVALSGAADVKAAISFHGALPTPSADDVKAVKCKVLVCHGADDKFIPDATIEKFKSAFDTAKVPYTFESYPGAVHSFTVKEADKVGNPGMKYNEAADQKSWAAMKATLKEAFAK